MERGASVPVQVEFVPVAANLFDGKSAVNALDQAAKSMTLGFQSSFFKVSK